MIRGIYTSAAALATTTLRLGVVSNNIANSSTPGYKQDRLPEEVGKPIDLMRWAVDSQCRSVGSLTLGPQVGVSQLDLAVGPLHRLEFQGSSHHSVFHVLQEMVIQVLFRLRFL